jgi:crossover junction endodeoxyribonuclease RusA
MNISFELPWPPTANTYWRRNGSRYFISTRGKDYRDYVSKVCYPYAGLFVSGERIKLSIDAFPPDRRIRDLDNLFKSVLDSIQAAKIFENDNQIDELSIRRMPWMDGKIIVSISSIA